MSVADIIIVSFVVLIAVLIIVIRYILPLKKGVPLACSSCHAAKRAKKYLKKYRKQCNK